MKSSESIHSSLTFDTPSVSFWCLTSPLFSLHCFGKFSSEFCNLLLSYFLHNSFSWYKRKIFHQLQIWVFASQFQIRFGKSNAWKSDGGNGSRKKANYFQQFHVVVDSVACSSLYLLADELWFYKTFKVLIYSWKVFWAPPVVQIRETSWGLGLKNIR